VIRRVAASVPLAVVLLDVTVVAVLLPDIRLDLGSSPSGGQWVLNAHLLALAAMLPLARGRAPAVAGALAMAAGAIVCARADSTSTLVVGQAIQGAGAAALLAPVATLAAAALPASALALGPFAGGLLAEQNWWHVWFWAGVPLAALAGAAALAAERPASAAPRPLACALGLTTLAIALVQVEVWAWGWTALLGLAGAALLASALPRDPAALAWAALAGCLAALLFVVPEYLQLARNLSGARSGVLMMVLTLAAVGAWVLSVWLGRSIPARARALAGLACLAIGLALLVPLDAHTRYLLVIAGLGLTGSGLGVVAAAVPDLLGGTVLEAPFAGAALGLAAGGAAFQLAQAGERESGATFEQALAAGAGWAAVALLIVLALAALAVRPASSAARPAAES
jgi:MFS family permease